MFADSQVDASCDLYSRLASGMSDVFTDKDLCPEETPLNAGEVAAPAAETGTMSAKISVDIIKTEGVVFHLSQAFKSLIP
jgi:hypothetical protein